MSVTYSVTLDSNLLFTFGSTRIADNDPLVFTAPSGVEVTIQITAPMTFTASHDEKGKRIAWKTVPTPTADGSCIMAWSFPCPRSPFTLTVSTAGASGTATGTTKTKKVRIEAGATGGARGHAVQAPGQQDD